MPGKCKQYSENFWAHTIGRDYTVELAYAWSRGHVTSSATAILPLLGQCKNHIKI